MSPPANSQINFALNNVGLLSFFAFLWLKSMCFLSYCLLSVLTFTVRTRKNAMWMAIFSWDFGSSLHYSKPSITDLLHFVGYFKIINKSWTLELETWFAFKSCGVLQMGRNFPVGKLVQEENAWVNRTVLKRSSSLANTKYMANYFLFLNMLKGISRCN